jgi:Galactosyltransferase
MNQSIEYCFLQKATKKNATRKQNLFYLILVTSLVMLIVFIKVQCGLKDVSTINPVVKNDFDWLRNKNFLPLYVRPEENTAVFVPNNISAIYQRQFIACFVISAPKNRISRNAIRQTWGKLIKPIFLIGQNDKETMFSVTHEARTFDDIIIEDFVDSYVNLTIKTAFAMKNFLTHFKDSKYFFKIDDDVFLNVESLNEMLKYVPKDALIGKAEFNSKPIKDKNNKWYVPKFLFEDECFPPYLHGPSYMIPGVWKEY